MQNILFLTLSNVSNIDDGGIYQDLLRAFARKGHRVFIVSPTERRNQEKTHLIKTDNANILRVRTGNIQKTNLIEKGIATILLETQYISAIKKYLSDVKFDLVLYSTPPITLAGAVQYIKKRDGAKTYLLLKDIFPQNAVDIGMMSKRGLKGLIYKYFRRKEKKLYAISDCIGCMSQANVDYVLKHNPEIPPEIVHVSPNSFDPTVEKRTEEEKKTIREKHGLPLDKKIFVYGGNLGKPQSVPFLIECMKSLSERNDAYFVVCGSGTEYALLEDYVKKSRQGNLLLLPGLPRADYEAFVGCCDVGLIFLDYRFTIPNFPSRLLSYMQKSLPVIACTDPATDIGDVVEAGGFGWKCESRDPLDFVRVVEHAIAADTEAMGENAAKYLVENYSVNNSVQIILSEYEKVKN